MSALKAERYATYMNSSVFGEVPASWDENALKRFCTRITDGAHTSPDLDENGKPFLSVVDLRNGELDFSLCKYTSVKDYESLVRNGCRPCKGDLLYSKDGTISETVVVREDWEFVVGSSFIIIRFNRKSKADYYFYLLSSQVMKEQARKFVRGAGLPRISIFNVAKLNVINPSFYEQNAIAAYLDTKTAQIDRQIDLLSQKATQYGKLKQSLINETVTRGLDKSVPMKDSDVVWIGEVPEHWGLKRLKELGDLYSGLTGKSGDDFSQENEHGEPFVPFTNIANNFYLSTSNLKLVVIHPSEKQNYVKINDLFFLMSSEDYADLGKCSLLTEEMKKKTYLNSFCKGFRFTKRTVNPKYINYLLHSTQYRLSLSNEGKGFTRINLRMDKINDMRLLIPSMSEQQAIAAYLDTKTTQIDRIVTAINTQINKLKDLRKALINDVVTGKIKVVSEGAAV
jgi:type I restriction enzyme, S subunit